MRIRCWYPAVLLSCGASASLLGCPAKQDPPATVVAAPSSASASTAPVPRVRVEVFGVRASVPGTPTDSLQVAAKLAYTPTKCDASNLLVPSEGVPVGKRRRMVVFRVKDVSLIAANGTRVVAKEGGETTDDTHPKEEGAHAIVIDCIDDVPDNKPFPFFFVFDVPQGFDAKNASLAIETERVSLAPYVK